MAASKQSCLAVRGGVPPLASMVLLAAAAQAAEPQERIQVPGGYRLMLGQFDVTALLRLLHRPRHQAAQKKATGEQMQSLVGRTFPKRPNVLTAVNAFLINPGAPLVLVDAGGAKQFGQTLGNIVDNLRAGGCDPAQVDAVPGTHLHGHHVNGSIAADGSRVFPEADVWSAKADKDFGVSAEIAGKAPKDFQALFKMARDAAAPYQRDGVWKTFERDQEKSCPASV